MKKIIASLLMLCLITVVVPPVTGEGENDNSEISTYAYSIQDEVN